MPAGFLPYERSKDGLLGIFSGDLVNDIEEGGGLRYETVDGVDVDQGS